MGRVKASKGLNRARGQRPDKASHPRERERVAAQPDLTGAGGYREFAATPGMLDATDIDITDCPACGLAAYEVGGTFDGRMTASCDHGHDWNIATGELTEISEPAEHRAPDVDDEDE